MGKNGRQAASDGGVYKSFGRLLARLPAPA